MRILFWFRKDLRLDDNTGLSEAERDARGDVVPFYGSEPERERADNEGCALTSVFASTTVRHVTK
jgi:deoxyribodipyrimidine photolyase